MDIMRMMRMAAIVLGLGTAGAANAQNASPPVTVQVVPMDRNACVYSGKVFSEGAYICVAKGTNQTCTGGKWTTAASSGQCDGITLKPPE
jgi:hypothetical protein